MKILPPRTRPPEAEISQEHSPPNYSGERGYRNFRRCLRWDFGFTCAFCLLHEADFMPQGTEGSGMMQIEHVELQSEAPERINDYSNCRYICKYCNQSRGAHPARTDEDKLLDPCNNTWSDYFCLSDDKLEIKEKTNGNAQKTKDVYDLNDSRKTTRRKERRRRLSELIQVIQEGPALRDQLQREAEEYAGNAPGKAREKLEQAKTVDKRIRYSKREIQRYRIKPDDSPEDCKCDRNLKLPAFLLDQSKEIEL